jgi:large subunit ribosomal protein L27
MAGASTAKNGRDSHSKRLGVKKYEGEKVIGGNIIIRQRGTKFRSGANTAYGRDHTIFAVKEGFIKFTDRNGHKVVNVLEKI